VVNHLAIEDYLPGVLARELYADWHLETFKAQAIAARSFALDRRSLSHKRHYDMESTQADQAYIGQTTNTAALRAVEDTRGQVLDYEYYILPAYYSSTCGGISQDARVGVGEYRNLLPLRGRHRGGWCRQSPTFRWGPIVRDRAALTTRIAQWGAARGHDVAALVDICEILVDESNSANRPTLFVITDSDGRRFELGAEAFRFACNFSSSERQKLPRIDQLKSSFVEVQVDDEQVVFTNGRGFGHGVGLCQFGAQGMALAGHDAVSILKFYYPGAEIIKAY